MDRLKEEKILKEKQLQLDTYKKGGYFIPFNGEYYSEVNELEWYKVENKDRYDKLQELLDTEGSEINNYPSLVCIETNSYNNENFVITLDNCLDYVKEVVSSLGMEIDFIIKEKSVEYAERKSPIK